MKIVYVESFERRVNMSETVIYKKLGARSAVIFMCFETEETNINYSNVILRTDEKKQERSS